MPFGRGVGRGTWSNIARINQRLIAEQNEPGGLSTADIDLDADTEPAAEPGVNMNALETRLRVQPRGLFTMASGRGSGGGPAGHTAKRARFCTLPQNSKSASEAHDTAQGTASSISNGGIYDDAEGDDSSRPAPTRPAPKAEKPKRARVAARDAELEVKGRDSLFKAHLTQFYVGSRWVCSGCSKHCGEDGTCNAGIYCEECEYKFLFYVREHAIII